MAREVPYEKNMQRSLVDITERPDQTLHHRSPNHLHIVEQLIGPGSTDPRVLEANWKETVLAQMPLHLRGQADAKLQEMDSEKALIPETEDEKAERIRQSETVLAQREMDLNAVEGEQGGPDWVLAGITGSDGHNEVSSRVNKAYIWREEPDLGG